MIFGFVLTAILIGCLMPVQASLNAALTKHLDSPYLASLVSLAIGAIAVSILVLVQGQSFVQLKKLSTVSPHLLLGGILGAVFVGSSLFFIPRMGATAMISAFITGQLLGSVLIDHFGLFGLPVNSIHPLRILGIFMLFAGVFLVVRKAA